MAVTATANPPNTGYTYAQLEGLWIQAGGSAATAPVAAAIADAESGGQSAAYNASGATGLWQILGLPAGFAAGANLYDPTVNASAAVAKYTQAGNSFSPWVTYTSGAYKAFLSTSTTPAANIPATSPAAAQAAATAAGATTCLVGFNSPSVLGLSSATVCIISKAQMRSIAGAALMTAGGLLVLAGAVLVAGIGLGQSRTAGRIASLTPAGKLVSAVS